VYNLNFYKFCIIQYYLVILCTPYLYYLYFLYNTEKINTSTYLSISKFNKFLIKDGIRYIQR